MKFHTGLRICLFSVICLLCSTAAAQKGGSSVHQKQNSVRGGIYTTTPRGYYIADGKILTAGQLLESNNFSNSQILRVKIARDTIEYTPEEVSEYGFSNGRIYVAREITLSGKTRKVFLERLADGNASLYFYKGKDFEQYFWETENSGLIELPRKKQQYREILARFETDCEGFANDLKLVSFKKASLTKLTERFSSCDPRPFPFTRFGVVAGGIVSRQIPAGYTTLDLMDAFKYGSSISYSAGLFMDKPLFASNLSIHAEILYSKMSHVYSIRTLNREKDYSAKYTSLTFPLLLRYTLPEVRYRPFVNMGAIFSYNIKTEEIMYEADIEDDIVVINSWSPSFVSTDYLGISIGSGIQYVLDFRKSLFFELRYNRLFRLTDQAYFDTGELQLITGINF
jgi:hypothetical protein